MSSTNFNSVASYYDVLAKLVFGSSLLKAKRSQLEIIRENQSVLILGGGTGELLDELSVLGKYLFIDYVELSSGMLKRAEKRGLSPKLKVRFVNESFLEFNSLEKYDIIFANFFLDVFQEEDLKTVISKIKSHLNEDGRLIATDFQQESISTYHKAILWMMHRFFRLFSKLPNRSLLPIRKQLDAGGFKENNVKEFMNGFVFSGVYNMND